MKALGNKTFLILFVLFSIFGNVHGLRGKRHASLTKTIRKVVNLKRISNTKIDAHVNKAKERGNEILFEIQSSPSDLCMDRAKIQQEIDSKRNQLEQFTTNPSETLKSATAQMKELENEKVAKNEAFAKLKKELKKGYDEKMEAPIAQLEGMEKRLFWEFENKTKESENIKDAKLAKAEEEFDLEEKKLKGIYKEWLKEEWPKFHEKLAKLNGEYENLEEKIETKLAEMRKKYKKFERSATLPNIKRIIKLPKKLQRASKSMNTAVGCPFNASNKEDQELLNLMRVLDEEERMEKSSSSSGIQLGKAFTAAMIAWNLRQSAKKAKKEKIRRETKKLQDLQKEWETKEKQREMLAAEDSSDYSVGSSFFSQSSDCSSDSGGSSRDSLSSQTSLDSTLSFISDTSVDNNIERELDALEIFASENNQLLEFELVEEKDAIKSKFPPELVEKYTEFKELKDQLDGKQAKAMKIKEKWEKLKEKKRRDLKKMRKEFFLMARSAQIRAELDFRVAKGKALVKHHENIETLYSQTMFKADADGKEWLPIGEMEQKFGTELADKLERAQTHHDWAIQDINRKLIPLKKLAEKLAKNAKIEGEIEKLVQEKTKIEEKLGGDEAAVEQKCEELLEDAMFEDALSDQEWTPMNSAE